MQGTATGKPQRPAVTSDDEPTAPVSSENEDAQCLTDSEDAETKRHKLIASIASTAPVPSVNEDAQVEVFDRANVLRELRELHAKSVRQRAKVLAGLGPNDPDIGIFDEIIKETADEIAALMQRNF